MTRINSLWSQADVKKRALYVGCLALIVYAIVYTLGNGVMYLVSPQNPQYIVTRTDNTSLKRLYVKKTTASWADQGIVAKNQTKQRLSVGNIVTVKHYWWFGEHTYVKDVTS